jgi:hypothetical protein
MSNTSPENRGSEDRINRSWRDNLESVITFVERYSAVLGGLGLLVYVMVRAAYEAFYGKLGVTPEEAGVTYLLIIARAALGIVIYLSIFLVAASFLAWLLQPRRSRTQENDQDSWTQSPASSRPEGRQERNRKRLLPNYHSGDRCPLGWTVLFRQSQASGGLP